MNRTLGMLPGMIILGLIMLAVTTPVTAALNIFACEPEWAALADELGGERVKSFSATTAFQDPHHIEARPSLIAKLRRADLLICSGAELEVGWLPMLQRQAGNTHVLVGKPGYFEAA
ncbi:MAG: zinc ABC transporter substrate-binding protein, partial [Gammaproteobacteria bacterium]|nr:zinc ABC transporter substrate-binding protein [Gammaproteobacteria bacterium]